MEPPIDLEGKIPDPALRRAAKERSAEAVSVLIELDVPRPVAEFVRAPGWGERLCVPTRIPPESAAEESALEERTTEAKVFLTELLGTEPVWLGAARAFVADATGEQLLTVARSPLIRAVQPNRRLA